MFQFPRFALPEQKTGNIRPSAGWVVPFGNHGVNAYVLLTRAYRSLSRPSSPL